MRVAVEPAAMLTVQDLLDRAAIHDVLVRYAQSVDRRDATLMTACFTPDAHADYGYFKGDPPTFIDAICTGVARYANTMHFLGNQLVELAGDRASVETYAVAYMRRDDAGTSWDLVQGLRYLDDLERRAGEWHIHRRVLKVEWERRDAVVIDPR